MSAYSHKPFIPSSRLLMAQVESAMSKFDADRAARLAAEEAGHLVPSLAEQRRDKLVKRGLARAARGRYYARMYGA